MSSGDDPGHSRSSEQKLFLSQQQKSVIPQESEGTAYVTEKFGWGGTWLKDPT